MFTIQDLKDAYEKTGLSPTCYRFFGPDYDCGCPLTTLIVAKHGKEAMREMEKTFNVDGTVHVWDWMAEKLAHFDVTKDEIVAFVTGFDGGRHYNDLPRPDVLRLGQIAREELNPMVA